MSDPTDSAVQAGAEALEQWWDVEGLLHYTGAARAAYAAIEPILREHIAQQIEGKDGTEFHMPANTIETADKAITASEVRREAARIVRQGDNA